MGKALIVRTGTDLERAESWASLVNGARKARAMQALATNDRAALAGLLDAYLHLHARAGLNTSGATLQVYRRGATRLLDWCNDNAILAHQLDTDSARRFLATMQGAGLADKSVACYLTGARSFVAALRWAGLGEGEPFAGLHLTDRTPAVEKANPYTPAELAKLLAKATVRERVFVLLCARGGLRLAEAVGLLWADVDVEGRKARITGKGRKVRTIGLSPQLIDALRAVRPQDEAGSVLGASRRRWQQILTDLCRRAGVESRGPHALRHTCGTALYARTKDLLAVARHLGHSSVTTSAIYAHLGSAAYAEAVDSLDVALPGQ